MKSSADRRTPRVVTGSADARPAIAQDRGAPKPEPRYGGLDSLRGIAACTVVLSHYCYLEPLKFLRHTPLRFVLGGHEAVILFFVLSAFVLTVQITARERFRYLGYAVRRVVRIYPPYLLTALCAFACFAAVGARSVPWAGDWFNGAWHTPLGADIVARHLVLILPFQTDAFVPVFWTLVYEMRISLVLPLLVFAFARAPIGVAGLAALALSAAAVFAGPHDAQLIFRSVAADWLPTVHYAMIFGVGTLLALHRRAVVARIQAGSYGRALFAVGVVLYLAGSVVGFGLHDHAHFALHDRLGDFLYDWIVAAGTLCLIAATIADARVAGALGRRPLVFLGEISYSLYLLHSLVLLTVLHALGDALPRGAAIGLALLATPFVAYLSYRFVESPSIRFGRWCGRRLDPR